jgi:DNA-binding PadR family transcriptional regulator
MRTEDLKRVILRMFGSREFYGYEVHKKLASEKIEVGISRLYRVLTEMSRDGLLEGRWEQGQLGPRKRLYTIGEKGRKEREKLFLAAIETVHEFYSEYMLTLPAETNVLNKVCKLLSSNVDRKGEIAYVSSQYSVIHEKMLRNLHDEMPEAKMYFVKPASLEVNLNLDNLWFLNGTYERILLRDGYVDLAIVAETPERNRLEKSLKEWHRVLKQDGKLAIVMPTIFVRKYDDPLSIGNFIEKYEHEAVEKGDYMEADALKSLLKKLFNVVEEKQIVHMTIFLAS